MLSCAFWHGSSCSSHTNSKDSSPCRLRGPSKVLEMCELSLRIQVCVSTAAVEKLPVNMQVGYKRNVKARTTFAQLFAKFICVLLTETRRV